MENPTGGQLDLGCPGSGPYKKIQLHRQGIEPMVSPVEGVHSRH